MTVTVTAGTHCRAIAELIADAVREMDADGYRIVAIVPTRVGDSGAPMEVLIIGQHA
jgi:hypothetical protein